MVKSNFDAVATITNMEDRTIWRDLDKMMNANQDLVDDYKKQVINANKNAGFEVGGLNLDLETSKHALIFSDTHDAHRSYIGIPGTELAQQSAKRLKDKALEALLFDNHAVAMEYFDIAAKFDPTNVELIKYCAVAAKDCDGIEEKFERFIHLAVLATENKDLELAKIVLVNNRVMHEELVAQIQSDLNYGLKPR